MKSVLLKSFYRIQEVFLHFTARGTLVAGRLLVSRVTELIKEIIFQSFSYVLAVGCTMQPQFCS